METKRTRRFFTPEFKKQAAERVIIAKEKTQAVAQDLDISVVSLYQWIREYEKLKSRSFGDSPETAEHDDGAAESTLSLFSPLEASDSKGQQVNLEQADKQQDIVQTTSKDGDAAPAVTVKPKPPRTKKEASGDDEGTKQAVPPVEKRKELQVKPEFRKNLRKSDKEKPQDSMPEREILRQRPVSPSSVASAEKSSSQVEPKSVTSLGPRFRQDRPVRPEARRARVSAPNDRIMYTDSMAAFSKPYVDEADLDVYSAPVRQPDEQNEQKPNIRRKELQVKTKAKSPRFQSEAPGEPADLGESEQLVMGQIYDLELEDPQKTEIADYDAISQDASAQDFFDEQEKGSGESNGGPRQKNKKQKNGGNDKNQPRAEAPVEEVETRPVPLASEGRSWKVCHALDQRPNFKEENETFGYVDEFSVPAENLREVWDILEVMQKNADKRAFSEMAHRRDIVVPAEVLEDPRAVTMVGPNVPNKPWLRKARMNPVAEEFFQNTPVYAKSVYETFNGLVIRLDKDSAGTPILSMQDLPNGNKKITVDFSKFDRFVDDYYGGFVHECKVVMMEINPTEYSSLNSFIRIPNEPLWNPKLWAGVQTFVWRNGESLSKSWIHHAMDQRKKRR